MFACWPGSCLSGSAIPNSCFGAYTQRSIPSANNSCCGNSDPQAGPAELQKYQLECGPGAGSRYGMHACPCLLRRVGGDKLDAFEHEIAPQPKEKSSFILGRNEETKPLECPLPRATQDSLK